MGSSPPFLVFDSPEINTNDFHELGHGMLHIQCSALSGGREGSYWFLPKGVGKDSRGVTDQGMLGVGGRGGRRCVACLVEWLWVACTPLNFVPADVSVAAISLACASVTRLRSRLALTAKCDLSMF